MDYMDRPVWTGWPDKSAWTRWPGFTARTGQWGQVSLGQECWSRTLRKQSAGWPEHDSKDRTTGDGTTVAGNRDRTAGKGQPRHVSLDRTDIRGKDMTITTGELWTRLFEKGQLAQDSEDRKTRTE